MNTAFVVQKPDGSMAEVAAIPLSSEHPAKDDMMAFHVEDGVMLFKVERREWTVKANPDGGGVNLRLVVVLFQIGQVPDERVKNGNAKHNHSFEEECYPDCPAAEQ